MLSKNVWFCYSKVIDLCFFFVNPRGVLVCDLFQAKISSAATEKIIFKEVEKNMLSKNVRFFY